MTFEIEVEGRRRVLALEPLEQAGPAGGRFRVVLRGGTGPGSRAQDEVLDVDVRPTDLGLSLIDRATGRSVDVAVTERAAGQVLLQWAAANVTAVVDGRRRGPHAEGSGLPGAQRIVAPMPGRIVRVLVQPGDRVTARQGVVVIEAMKMENELIALRDGRVQEVAVAAGAAVEAGRLLVLIEA